MDGTAPLQAAPEGVLQTGKGELHSAQGLSREVDDLAGQAEASRKRDRAAVGETGMSATEKQLARQEEEMDAGSHGSPKAGLPREKGLQSPEVLALPAAVRNAVELMTNIARGVGLSDETAAGMVVEAHQRHEGTGCDLMAVANTTVRQLADQSEVYAADVEARWSSNLRLGVVRSLAARSEGATETRVVCLPQSLGADGVGSGGYAQWMAARPADRLEGGDTPVARLSFTEPTPKGVVDPLSGTPAAWFTHTPLRITAGESKPKTGQDWEALAAESGCTHSF
jgi:hypothetical protein